MLGINLLTQKSDDKTDGWINESMLPGCKLLQEYSANMQASSENRRDNSDFEKKKTLVKKYFAYYETNKNFVEPYHVSINDLGTLQKKLLGKKKNLISYVVENSWVRTLSESDVNCIYEDYIDDMLDCMLEQAKAKIVELRKYFSFI